MRNKDITWCGLTALTPYEKVSLINLPFWKRLRAHLKNVTTVPSNLQRVHARVRNYEKLMGFGKPSLKIGFPQLFGFPKSENTRKALHKFWLSNFLQGFRWEILVEKMAFRQCRPVSTCSVQQCGLVRNLCIYYRQGNNKIQSHEERLVKHLKNLPITELLKIGLPRMANNNI